MRERETRSRNRSGHENLGPEGKRRDTSRPPTSQQHTGASRLRYGGYKLGQGNHQLPVKPGSSLLDRLSTQVDRFLFSGGSHLQTCEPPGGEKTTRSRLIELPQSNLKVTKRFRLGYWAKNQPPRSRRSKICCPLIPICSSNVLPFRLLGLTAQALIRPERVGSRGSTTKRMVEAGGMYR